MKLPKNNRIELAASADKTRFAICEPYLSGDKLVATNGRMLVVLPVERDPEDVDGYVTAQALTMARKTGHKKDCARLTCNGHYAFADGATLPRTKELTDSRFPNWQQVIPKVDPAKPRTRVTLSIAYLTAIAKALDAEHLTLEVAGENDAVLIRAKESPDALAVLMPYRTA